MTCVVGRLKKKIEGYLISDKWVTNHGRKYRTKREQIR